MRKNNTVGRPIYGSPTVAQYNFVTSTTSLQLCI